MLSFFGLVVLGVHHLYRKRAKLCYPIYSYSDFNFYLLLSFFEMYAMNFLKDKSCKFVDLLNSSLFSYFASSMISSSKNLIVERFHYFKKKLKDSSIREIASSDQLSLFPKAFLDLLIFSMSNYLMYLFGLGFW